MPALRSGHAASGTALSAVRAALPSARSTAVLGSGAPRLHLRTA